MDKLTFDKTLIMMTVVEKNIKFQIHVPALIQIFVVFILINYELK